VSGLTLDTGALIAFERNDRVAVSILARALERKLEIAVPAGAVGQAWRDGRKQARLARLLRSQSVEIVPLDDATARRAGQLCGVRRTSDIIDASVVLCARERDHAVMTADLTDFVRLDPALHLIVV